MGTDKILGRWVVMSPVDMGANQEAYLCENECGEQRVLWWPSSDSSEIMEKFSARITRVKGFSHECIAKVYDLVRDKQNSRDVAIVEHCGGEPIFYASRGLNFLQRLCLLIQVLDGLDFMHAHKILHLNIKSDSVYADLLRMRAKIIHWGAAMPMDEVSALLSKPIGSPSFISPEICLGHIEKISARADLFSWTVLAYLVFSGVLPFPDRREAKNEIEKLKNIIGGEKPPPPIKTNDFPSKMNEMILGMLKPDPDDRPFISAKSVAEALIKKYPGVEGLKGTSNVIKTNLESI